MKTKIITLFICCLALITACEKDGSIIKVFGLDSSELTSNLSDVILTKESSSSNVLTLAWDESALGISDTAMKLPNSMPLMLIEASATNTFDSIIVITPTSNSYIFTGAALNTLGKNLKFTAGISTSMYLRIKASYGVNTQPYYSNTLTLNVTCYTIDMSIAFVLNSSKEDTGFKLYSPESNGEYYGFAGSSAWFNWYLQEGDGVTWGNLPVDGNAFVLAKDGSPWNFWYPGQSGCYFTTVSTTNKEWTATYIPALSLSGDVTGAMAFDKANVKWYISITTTSDNAKVKVSGNASLYNKTTSTDDGAAVAKTIGFIPHADSTITFDWSNTSAGEINIAKAGDYTLTLYLSNPKKWTFELKEGKTVIVKPLSKKLYLMGIDDGISGSWNFNNYLTLVSEDDSSYAGIVNVNSQWGYQMALDSGEWTNVYKMGATEGTLLYKSGSNITAPSPGLYLIQVNLKNKTYSHTAVTSLSQAGLNDNWTLVPMTASGVTGVYTSSVTISAASQWGCKLYLNGGWDNFFGGKDGILSFKGNGITDDATIGAGTYDLVANVIKNTYVFLGNQVYIGGLNDVWDFTSVILTKTSAGIYTGTATINTISSYGIKIYLDQSWNRYFGGSFATMKYLGANITDDKSLTTGTYNITVNFLTNTCSFVKQ